jgi:MarR family transcriptional regulator, organic hydroperoxide resistance regulator
LFIFHHESVKSNDYENGGRRIRLDRTDTHVWLSHPTCQRSPWISQKELSEKLSITASTLTRFIDKLEGKQLVERKVQGKSVLVYPTAKGNKLEEAIRRASKNLLFRYEAILSKETSEKLTKEIESVSDRLEKK